jgi:RHS repeat-associated protein
MSRRVEKKSYTYNSGWGSPTTRRFVYDRWNVVLVLDGSNATVNKYTWGLDLSGQRGGVARASSPVDGIHGAGGIGGLLAVEETSTSGTPKYWFLYDANGNVGQLVKNTTSPTNYPLTAHYEYDAYGQAVVTADVDSSDYVNINPFRFSTKWFDDQLSVSYFGRRYYARGRWLNRDPIGEKAGRNLYGFPRNNALNLIDPFGLQECDPFWGCPSPSPEPKRDPCAECLASGGGEFWCADLCPKPDPKPEPKPDPGTGRPGPKPNPRPPSYGTPRCLCCVFWNQTSIQAEAERLYLDWLKNGQSPSNKCAQDAMQHCIGGAVTANTCGLSCAKYASPAVEAVQPDGDWMDIHNGVVGANHCGGKDPVKCCEEALADNLLSLKGDCK